MLSFFSGWTLTGIVVPAVAGLVVAAVTNVVLVSTTTGAPSDSANPGNQDIIVYGTR